MVLAQNDPLFRGDTVYGPAHIGSEHQIDLLVTHAALEYCQKSDALLSGGIRLLRNDVQVDVAAPLTVIGPAAKEHDPKNRS